MGGLGGPRHPGSPEMGPRHPGGPTPPGVAPTPAPVVVHEHVDDVAEQVGLAGAEEAAAELIDRLAQLGQPLVEIPRAVPGGPAVRGRGEHWGS